MFLSVGTGQTEWNVRARLKLRLNLFIETYLIRKQCYPAISQDSMKANFIKSTIDCKEITYLS